MRQSREYGRIGGQLIWAVGRVQVSQLEAFRDKLYLRRKKTMLYFMRMLTIP